MIDTRWWVLSCCALIVFVSSFFEQLPGSLAQRLTGTAIECINGADTCVNLSLYQFNMISSVDFLTRAVGAILAGVIIDRYGTKYALWGCAASMVVGPLLFTLGAYVSTTGAAYGMMLTARLIFGGGTGSYGVILHRVKAGWFMYKELALAFSVEILFDRLGSATAYLLYGGIVGSVGLRDCLWIGVAFSAMAAGALVLLAHLDSTRTFSLNWTSPAGDTRPRTIWFSLRYYDVLFWLFVILVCLNEGAIQAFIADAEIFFATRYGYTEKNSIYIAGVIYDLALFAPLVGWFTDKYGRRQYSLSIGVTLIFLGFLVVLTVQTTFPAVLLMFFVGTGYATYAPVIWSSIPLIVSPESVGLAMGLGKFAACAGSGSAIAVVGAILDMRNDEGRRIPWETYLFFLVMLSGISVLISLIIIFLNTRTGYRLSYSQKEMERSLPVEDAETTPLKTNLIL